MRLPVNCATFCFCKPLPPTLLKVYVWEEIECNAFNIHVGDTTNLCLYVDFCSRWGIPETDVKIGLDQLGV